MKKTTFVLLLVLLGLSSRAQEGFIGEVRMFAGNFAPRGWAFCQGQMLPISQNTALFSILGTTYGGDGRTTFALPDLRGRVPVQSGAGTGLSSYRLGESGGSENITVNFPGSQMTDMAKSKDEMAKPQDGSQKTQMSASGQPQAGSKNLGGSGQGSTQVLDNRQPYLGLNYIICLQGIFPSRN